LIWTGVGTPSVPNAVTVVAPEALGTPARAADASVPDPARPSGSAERADVRDSVTGPVLPESDPVTVSIPRLGVRSTLVELGLDADGAMEVPRDPARAGWFSRGPAPGALGPAVIAGHVTWNGAPGVFYRLTTLRPGDRLVVARADGRTVVFTVDRVARFAKSRFPTGAV
jgi:hypothetical protein